VKTFNNSRAAQRCVSHEREELRSVAVCAHTHRCTARAAAAAAVQSKYVYSKRENKVLWCVTKCVCPMMMSCGCVAGVPETGLRRRAFLSVCVSSSHMSSTKRRQAVYITPCELTCAVGRQAGTTSTSHHGMICTERGNAPTQQQFYQQLLVAVNAVLRHAAYMISFALQCLHCLFV
jgi:hypothetical protein